MRLTVAAETPTSAAICAPVWRCLRKASTAAQTAGAVWLGDERGFDERSCKPATPDPFGDRLRRRVELPRRSHLRQTAFNHATRHRLSTFRRKRRILVRVHSASPRITEVWRHQRSRLKPNGQPPESSQLERESP